MKKKTLYILQSLIISSLAIKPEKLPLCPTSINFLPQNLPMHCRMARSISVSNGVAVSGATPGAAPSPPASPFYQSPPLDKVPGAVPIPMPPGPLPYPFPGLPPGLPMPMPMPVPGPSHKLPVIVMPFYSPDPSFKPPQEHDHTPNGGHDHPMRPRRPRKPRRRPRITDSDSSTDTDTESSDTDTSSDTSSETSSDTSGLTEKGWWNPHGRRPGKRSGRRSTKKHSHKTKRKHKQQKEILTPVLQYVTKDGYVIFEKTISKGEAKDWLKMRADEPDPNNGEIGDGTKGIAPKNNEAPERNDNDKDKYDEKSGEHVKKVEETTTAKPNLRPHKKHHIKPNLLLTSRS